MDLVSPNESDGLRHADILPVELRDPNALDRSRMRRIVYEVQQRFRYCYAAPICNLRQRLVVVPRPVHGGQRLLSHRLEVSQSRSCMRMRSDRFGNVIVGISIAEVREAVEFEISLTAERLPGQGTPLEAATRRALNAYLLPSALTRPDTTLRAAAIELASNGKKGADLARAVGSWVYGRMSYGFDQTSVHTTQARRSLRVTASARTTPM